MARLPVVNSDDGVWGSVLNEFLLVSHNGDGSMRENSVTQAVITQNAVNEDKLDAGVRAKLNKNSVESVNTKTGAVVLEKADVGLDNVDNTSDVNKPVSTATQAALDTKVSVSVVDNDATLAADSNTRIPTQNAIKTYVDNGLAGKADASDFGAKVLLIDTAASLPPGTPADVIVVVKGA